MRNMDDNVLVEISYAELITMIALLECTVESISPEDGEQRESRSKLYRLMRKCKMSLLDQMF